MHETSTRSPTATLLTPVPTSVTVPTASWPKNAPDGDLGHVTLQDVQIGATDGGGIDSDDGVGVIVDGRLGHLLPRLQAWAFIDECLHGMVLLKDVFIPSMRGIGQVHQGRRSQQPRPHTSEQTPPSSEPPRARPRRHRGNKESASIGRRHVEGLDASVPGGRHLRRRIPILLCGQDGSLRPGRDDSPSTHPKEPSLQTAARADGCPAGTYAGFVGHAQCRRSQLEEPVTLADQFDDKRHQVDCCVSVKRPR